MTLSPNSTPSTTADQIYRTMRERIITAQWLPGERLVHRHLAKQFGTSNIPILEALRRLESDGLVTSYPNAGAQVRVWTESDVRGAFLAREALEGVTCSLFAQQASPMEKAKLRVLGKKFDDACREGNFVESRRIDIGLHLYIAGDYNPYARASVLFHLVQNACLLSATITSISMDKSLLEKSSPEAHLGPVGVHDELIEALNTNDAELAERAGQAHVRNAMEGVLEILAAKDTPV